MILYFFEDQTNAGKNAKAMMTYVAMISLVFSLLAAWPAGFLSDKFGSGIVAALGSILMSKKVCCAGMVFRILYIYW